jgi:hypothetical protein
MCNIWQHRRQNNVSGRQKARQSGEAMSPPPPVSWLCYSYVCVCVRACMCGQSSTGVAKRRQTHADTTYAGIVNGYFGYIYNSIPGLCRPWDDCLAENEAPRNRRNNPKDHHRKLSMRITSIRLQVPQLLLYLWKKVRNLNTLLRLLEKMYEKSRYNINGLRDPFKTSLTLWSRSSSK